MKKIVICGGHLTPALAAIEHLENKDIDIIFFGRKYSAETSKNPSAEFREVSMKNIPFINITAGKLPRHLTKYSVLSILKIPLGFFSSFIYLLKYRPSLVVSFGGYISLPVVFSAWLLGIDSITHEQASKPGLATRINSLFVKKIFLAWPQAKDFFPKDKTEVIGNPQRASLLKKTAQDKKIAPFLSKKGVLIFISGGNTGSHVLNKVIFKSKNSLKKFLIFHQVGTANYMGDLEKAKTIKDENYFAIDYISTENIGAVFQRADFLISRSGANTVWDLATLGKPAILVPLAKSAGGEQAANAKILESAGSAIIISQKELTQDTLKTAIDKMQRNLPSYQKAAGSLKNKLPKNAAAKLAAEILSYT